MPRTRVCIKEADKRIALADLDLAGPGPGQALVRTTVTTICGSDIHIVDDIPEVPPGTPMGHEAVGIVDAVGEGVSSFRPGDRVVASCLISCGSCAPCTGGEPQICATYAAPMNLLFGAQSDMFLVPSAEHSMAKIPDAVDDTTAIFAADILPTGLGAVERAGVAAGTSVAIFAQGPVGLCATLAAKHAGAEPIIAVERIAERQRMARHFGADLVVEPERALDEIMRATHGRGVDVAIEALGKQETFEACCRVTRLGGVVSSVGVYGGIEYLRLPTDGSFIHRTIVTTLCPAGRARLEHVLRLLADGVLDPRRLLTHERTLAEIEDAYAMFRAREDGVLKIAIRG